MALTADEKEAIMAARGESYAPTAVKSKTRRYDVRFADGKGATVLDMLGEDAEVCMDGIRSIFADGYVLSITPT